MILTCDAKPANYLIETLDDNSLIGNASTSNGVQRIAIFTEDTEDDMKKKKRGSDYQIILEE